MSFAKHLEDAIRLNLERMPLYSRLTGGESGAVSRRLIRWERLALPVARWVDRRARPYQARGIPVVTADFVSMAGTPEFRERAPEPPLPLSDFRRADARRIRRAVGRALARGGFAGAAAALRGELAALEAARCYHCMLRHLLESMLRIAVLAPRHAARAEALGMRPPVGLSRLLLRLHLLVLADAAKLDAQAAPIQARGIPILCQDVPPIPPG
ncbi:MAG TPA: hypothetical protein VHG28_17175 [Longimicrobiaceae bacterium]|nr:hypothetical protein [Longimicrobiaceae bacterium]